MKRLLVVAAALILPLTMAPSAGAAAHGSLLGITRACTHGQARCFALVVTRNGAIVNAATPAALPAGYGPAQFHAAYNLPTLTPLIKNSTKRRHVRVAIVDAYDDATIQSDLSTYSTTFGLPQLPACSSSVKNSCFQKVNMGAPAGSAHAQGWDVEIALDVETVHAICENCKIVLVEAPDSSLFRLAAAEDKAASLASIVSNSYGSYTIDGSLSILDNDYQHPKKAIVVSAGDSGYGAAWPAVLNTVVSVGGTSLTLGSNNSYGSETAWGPTPSNAWGTGSGCGDGSVSGLSAIPAQPFQSGVANYAKTGCGTSRGDNDVAADADPYTGSAVYSNGWIQVGGTSLAAPLIAGVYGLKANASSVNYPASFLYAANGTPAFHDVTSGSNDALNYPIACDHSTTACEAAVGYDLPTGVGTPNGRAGF